MRTEPTCKDCGQSIKWVNTNGRWIPMTPGGDERHRCQLDLTCEAPGCGKAFKGAPWMKVCPACYKRDSGKADNSSPDETSAARRRESLREDIGDDDPF